MCFMAVRLLAMHRVLKPTGSLYLHCDPTASHYLKAIMDAIFGWRNFRNQITWQRSNSHNTANRYASVSEVILYYTKSSDFVWNQQYQSYGESQLGRFRHKDQDGRLYKLDDLAASRINSDSGKFDWRGTLPPSSRGWGGVQFGSAGSMVESGSHCNQARRKTSHGWTKGIFGLVER